MPATVPDWRGSSRSIPTYPVAFCGASMCVLACSCLGTGVEGETCGQDFVCRSWRCRWQCGHEHARRLVAGCFYYISASNGEGCITNGYQWLSWKTNVLNAAWHTEGEQELRSCGARLTFLRPTMFYSSILQASKPPALASKCARCIGT